MNYWMVRAPVDIGVRPLGVAPVSAEHLSPPGCRCDASGVGEIGGEQAGKNEGRLEPLRFSEVARVVYERGEALIRDSHRVDPEAPQPDLADRSLAVGRVAELICIAHQELAAGNQYHPVGGGASGCQGNGFRHSSQGPLARPARRAAGGRATDPSQWARFDLSTRTAVEIGSETCRGA